MNDDNSKKDQQDSPGVKIRGEDRRLWEFVAKTITPLHPDQGRNTPAPPPAMPTPTRKPQFWRTESPDIRLKIPKTPPSGNKDTENKTDPRTAARLRQGKLRIEATLDLHGMHQAGAQSRLFGFLHESAGLGRRCVLIITGKGARTPGGEIGVLRRALPLWLEMEPVSDLILSFSPARPKDGGDGAFYVLLRRQRPIL